MRISILIVTYGDRFQYLRQVLNRCVFESIKDSRIFEIIIVDNNSFSTEKIFTFIKENKDINIKHIILEKNIGSAGGYSAGLEYFLETESDYVLLLDDDNLIEEGFVGKFYNFFELFEEKDRIVLVANRLVNDQKDWYDDVRMDIFNFSIFDILLKKIFKNLKNRIREEVFLPIRPTLIFSYGGAIIHKNIIKDIGLPNKDYFVYVDDSEWSYRMYKKYPIYTIYRPGIKDLEIYNHSSDRLDIFTNVEIVEFRLIHIWYNTYFFYTDILNKSKGVLYFKLYIYVFFIFLSLLAKKRLSKISIKRIILYIKYSKKGVRDGKKGIHNIKNYYPISNGK